ncbi:MAG: cation:dicarboxylase symporter family transporter [bacterium]|nr:cation:dicarboxylase symporter family transporter [bacterium]
MTDAKLKWIMFGSILGILAGFALGYALPEAMVAVGFIGGLFLNGLKVLIAPLIVTSIVVGITSLGSGAKVGRTTISAILYFAATTAIAVTIGLVLTLLIRPGAGVDMTGATFPQILSNYQGLSFPAILGSLIPASVPAAVLQGNYLGLAIISIILGFVLSQLGRAGKKLTDLFTDFNDLVFKLIQLVMLAMPVGLLFLIGYVVASNPGSIEPLFSGTLSYALVVLVAFAIHGFLVLPAALKILTSRSIRHTSSRLLPAFAAAFGTASSVATLPVTTDCAINRCQIDRRAGSYVLPLGSVLNVDGTAMYAIIGMLFIAQAFAVALTFPQILLLSLVAVALSFGVSAIPNSSLFIMFVMMGVGGFPTEAYGGLGILAIFDWLFDRLRTMLNIWSDTVGAAVVAETFEFKTASGSRSSRARSGQRPGRRERSADSSSSKWSDRKSRSERPSDRRSSDGRTDDHKSEDRRPIRGRRAERNDSRVAPERRGQQRTEFNPRKEPSPFQVSAAEDHPIDLDSPVTAATRRRSESRNGRPDRHSARSTENGDNRSARRESSKVSEQSASTDRERTRDIRTAAPRPERKRDLSPEPVASSVEKSSSETTSTETVSPPYMPPPPPLPVFDRKPERDKPVESESKPEPTPVAEQPKPAESVPKPPVKQPDSQPAEEQAEISFDPPKPAPTKMEPKETPFEVEDIAPAVTVVDDEIEETELEEVAAPRYGRKVHRKGVRSSGQSAPQESNADESQESDEDSAKEEAFSTASQSFGRTIKKKPRK